MIAGIFSCYVKFVQTVSVSTPGELLGDGVERRIIGFLEHIYMPVTTVESICTVGIYII